MFGLGARLLYETRPTIQNRVAAWQDPLSTELYEKRSAAATSSRRGSSRRPTAGCSARGSGARSCSTAPRAGNRPLPAAKNDFIYALIVNEVGLVRRVGLL